MAAEEQHGQPHAHQPRAVVKRCSDYTPHAVSSPRQRLAKVDPYKTDRQGRSLATTTSGPGARNGRSGDGSFHDTLSGEESKSAYRGASGSGVPSLHHSFSSFGLRPVAWTLMSSVRSGDLEVLDKA